MINLPSMIHDQPVRTGNGSSEATYGAAAPPLWSP